MAARASSVRLDDSAEATAYYVLSETTTNAQKHAQASAIHVRATFSQGMLNVEVADDGVGGRWRRTGAGSWAFATASRPPEGRSRSRALRAWGLESRLTSRRFWHARPLAPPR